MINISLTEDLRPGVELAREYPAALDKETVAALRRIEARLTRTILKRTPAGVGGQAGLWGSIGGEIVQRGDAVSLIEGTPLEYAPVVEMGRRPGKRMPPVAPIELWARRKLGCRWDAACAAAPHGHRRGTAA